MSTLHKQIRRAIFWLKPNKLFTKQRHKNRHLNIITSGYLYFASAVHFSKQYIYIEQLSIVIFLLTFYFDWSDIL